MMPRLTQNDSSASVRVVGMVVEIGSATRAAAEVALPL